MKKTGEMKMTGIASLLTLAIALFSLTAAPASTWVESIAGGPRLKRNGLS